MVSSRRLGAVLAALAVGASACSLGSADAGESPRGGSEGPVEVRDDGVGPTGTGPAPDHVSIAIRVDVDNFDPIRSLGDSGAQQAFALVYETLVRRGPDGEIVPGAASEWKIDANRATFTIKPGLTCSDGTPLDAAAVAESLRVFGSEGSMTTSSAFGRAGLREVTHDDAAGTVTIVTEKPYNDMLHGLTSSAYLVCPAGLADRVSLVENPVGSGPYELVGSTSSEWRFRLREDYTNLPEGTTIDDLPTTITLTTISDDGTAADLLGQGRLTIAGTQSSVTEFLSTDPTLVAVRAAGFGTNAVAMMQDGNAATRDRNLRRAIAMLLDSEEGGRAATSGQGIGRRTLLTPNLACWDETAAEAAPAYDPAAAAKLLDESGYRVGSNGKRTRPDGSRLVLRVVGNNLQGSAPEYIASQLESADFEVDLFVGTYMESIVKLLTDQFDLGIYPFVSTYQAPSSWPNQIGTGVGANFSKVSNATFDELTTRSEAAPQGSEEHCSLWNEAERTVLAEANVVPLAQPVNHWFGRGVTFNATYFVVDPFSIRSR